MRVTNSKEALEVMIFAEDYNHHDRLQVLQRGTECYKNSDADIIDHIRKFAEWSFDPTIRTSTFDEPQFKEPEALAIIATTTACALRKHPYLETAPPEAIQLISNMRELYGSLMVPMVMQQDSEFILDLASRMYEKEYNADRPHLSGGATAIVHHPDAHPEFEKFFEIPLVAASDSCKARFTNGEWQGGYDPEENEAVGQTNYHIRDNNVYVPIQHGSAKLWEQQKKSFKALLDTNWEKTADEDFAGIYSECNILEQEVNELLDHGQKDEIWSSWDPDQNLLRLVRNAAQEVDDLDPTEFNEASEYYAAITKYDADGFGEDSAKTKLKGVKSLSAKLTSYADRDDIRGVERRARADHEPVLFKLGGGGSGAKEITVNTLEDIFELPCFENMVEDLRVENGGPVRKDLYNFVAMVMWLQDYHQMSHENMKQAVVDDVANLFEKKWDWYDPAETNYQVGYEIDHGTIDGEDALPMGCDNDDMKRHCIGKENCPYSIYQSLPFPQEMYDLLDDLQGEAEV